MEIDQSNWDVNYVFDYEADGGDAPRKFIVVDGNHRVWCLQGLKVCARACLHFTVH